MAKAVTANAAALHVGHLCQLKLSYHLVQHSPNPIAKLRTIHIICPDGSLTREGGGACGRQRLPMTVGVRWAALASEAPVRLVAFATPGRVIARRVT